MKNAFLEERSAVTSAGALPSGQISTKRQREREIGDSTPTRGMFCYLRGGYMLRHPLSGRLRTVFANISLQILNRLPPYLPSPTVPTRCARYPRENHKPRAAKEHYC